MAQFALAWVIHQPVITSVVIGLRSHELLDDNLGALNMDITAEYRQLIDKLVTRGTVASHLTKLISAPPDSAGNSSGSGGFVCQQNCPPLELGR